MQVNEITYFSRGLLVVAAVVRGDFAFTVLYLFLGAFLLGRWWSGKALTNVTCQRFFESHAFLGEDVTVRLVIRNRSWLPIAWLRLYESLPVDLLSQRRQSGDHLGAANNLM
jgi:uncharacterized protein (DUF58 family)